MDVEKCIDEFGESYGYKRVSLIYEERPDIIDKQVLENFLRGAELYLSESAKTNINCPCPDNINPGNLLEFLSINYKDHYAKAIYNMGFRPSLYCPSRVDDKYKITIILPNGSSKQILSDKSDRFRSLQLWTDLIVINNGEAVKNDVKQPEIVNPFEKISSMFGNEGASPDQPNITEVFQTVSSNMTKMFEGAGLDGAPKDGQPPCCIQ